MPLIIGSKHHSAKLNPQKVRHARRWYADGKMSVSQIARKYGVTWATMKAAIDGKTWSHVK